MKKIFCLVTVLFFSVIMHAQKQYVADANAEKRSLNGSFDSIMVSGGIDIYLSQSDKEEVAVSASDEKFIQGIKTVIENNILKIYYKGDIHWNSRNRQIRAYISFKDLGKIDASGASGIFVTGKMNVPSLLLKLSGASDFKGEVIVNTLTMELSGASDVSINGTASIVKIESSGASDVKGYDLATDICNAKASGASDINITVNKELTAHASGASDISFKGNAIIKDQQSSGASSVSRKNR